MKSSTEVAEEINITLHPLEKTLKTMLLQKKITETSKEKLLKNIGVFEDLRKKISDLLKIYPPKKYIR